MDRSSFDKLIEYLKGKRVFIQTHNFPDPDAIGAGFGLQGILKSFGIDSILCYVGQIDRINTKKMTELCNIKIYSEDETPLVMRSNDPVICVDSQKGGGNIKDLPGDEIACIDHHPLIENEDYMYRDVRTAGSCATLITQYYEELSIEPDEYTATALLYGLKIDTMNFTRGVTQADIKAFSYLLDRSSQDIIERLTMNSMEFSDLQAYGAAIESIFVYDRIGFAGIPFACPDAQIGMVADFILSLDEVDVAVVYAHRKDGIKFSVRSEVVRVNAGKLIAEAVKDIGSGGGHSFMAGGFIPAENVEKLGTFKDDAIRERFLSADEQLREDK
ncbi:MAG: DHH family phosphoesterase [Lachnospiraceae bacterium]|nr:DHH family phosphoesterase [Lachnospiraceae bacterium]